MQSAIVTHVSRSPAHTMSKVNEASIQLVTGQGVEVPADEINIDLPPEPFQKLERV